ncbi:MAG: hypothetical protein D6702_07355 [Planctomycetota bacterium]|nr:MAG: hypothetical protein D6702_07355 [Planctomycetota bacterium]
MHPDPPSRPSPPGAFVRPLLVFLLAGLVAPPASAQAEPTDPAGWDLSGRIEASLRYRSQERRSEDDLSGALSAWADGTLYSVDGREKLRFSLDGLFLADLDGLERPAESFYGLGDTRNDRTRAFLYGAWVESAAVVEGLRLRAGRQEIHREEALWFDGLRLATEADGPVTGLVYAGAPVRFSESDRSGDFLGGFGLRWAPSRGLSLAGDEVFFRDRAPAWAPDRTLNNNLTVLAADWYRDGNTAVHATSSWIGEDPRRQELSILWNHPREGWWTRIRLRHQSDYGEAVVTDLSPFAAVVGDVAPYWTGLAEIRRRLTASADLALGYAGRWLDRDADEGTYDREYTRWYALLRLDGIPGPQMETGLRGDLWDATGAAVAAGGFYVAWKPAEATRLEAGTEFTKYRYDAFTGREYLDDRQYSLRFRQRLGDRYSLRLRLARDHSQFGADTLIEGAVALEF